jgi:hypothetical protein
MSEGLLRRLIQSLREGDVSWFDAHKFQENGDLVEAMMTEG